MKIRTALAASLVLLTLTASAPAAWEDADLGAPTAAGKHSEAGGVVTVVGAGKGEAARADQLHFTYQSLPAGDIEFIARIVALDGAPAQARAGLMLRADSDPSATKAEIGFFVSREGRNTTYCRYRDLGAQRKEGGLGYHTTMKLPIWLRIVRVGDNFAVARSQDGVTWVQVHNDSGGAFTVQGPFQVGFFVSSGDAAQTATAQFDQIVIRQPQLAYRTSWIGATYSQASVGHVSGAISALWVGADGTCLTNTYFDEAGQASKVYKDGRVVASFRDENEGLGNSFCGEGSITSDGVHSYIVARQNIYRSDLRGSREATEPLYFAESLWDEAKNVNVTSGMVIVGEELFISDSRAGKIRVATNNATRYYQCGNSTVNHAPAPIDLTGVPHAAPALVYQTQREVDYLPYKIPGLEPNTEYTVRFHLAEYKHEQRGKRLIEVHAGGQRATFDLVELAGGIHKAAVLELKSAKTQANGELQVTLSKSAGNVDGHLVLCGLEMLTPEGKQVFALNCGGPAVEGFQPEAHELVARAFAFERPGPMTADKRGELWIIQQANDFPVGTKPTTKYPAAIKCYRTDGTFTGRQITDVVNPTAVAYDPVNDRLLVAENGPDQNIRIYSTLDSSPTHASSFGIVGGIYAGNTPGLIHDPAAGGDARFYGLSGVGIDAEQNIYVACSSSGADLRKFTPEGKMLWRLNGLHFVDCGNFDPDSDGTEVYCPFKHYTLDYAQTQPGGEWRYTAYNWNPAKYGPPQRGNVSSAIIRRLGPKRERVLYTSGQGQVGHIGIFRFEGEINVPAGRIEAVAGKVAVWIDSNGDGQETPDEVSSCPGSIGSYSVDQRGDLWIAFGGAPSLRHFRFLGFNEHGVPRYGTQPEEYEDIPYPSSVEKISMRGQVARVVYDSERDRMYLIGPAKDRGEDIENPVSYLARYDDWSQGNRTPKWRITLPDPATDPNFMYTPPQPYNLAFHWMAFDVAVDKIFVVELWGPVHVFDAETGQRDTILIPGPEVSGGNAWEDAQMGIHAVKRQNGEYVILTENSGWHAKNNMYRWKPNP